MDGSALKKNCGAAIAEGAIDHIGVPCDPADVCHAAKDVPVLVVKHVLHKRREAVRGTAWAPQQGGQLGAVYPLSALILLHPSVFPPGKGHLLPAESFLKHYQKKKKSGALRGCREERHTLKKKTNMAKFALFQRRELQPFLPSADV